jgi:hypothetical protein
MYKGIIPLITDSIIRGTIKKDELYNQNIHDYTDNPENIFGNNDDKFSFNNELSSPVNNFSFQNDLSSHNDIDDIVINDDINDDINDIDVFQKIKKSHLIVLSKEPFNLKTTLEYIDNVDLLDLMPIILDIYQKKPTKQADEEVEKILKTNQSLWDIITKYTENMLNIELNEFPSVQITLYNRKVMTIRHIVNDHDIRPIINKVIFLLNFYRVKSEKTEYICKEYKIESVDARYDCMIPINLLPIAELFQDNILKKTDEELTIKIFQNMGNFIRVVIFADGNIWIQNMNTFYGSRDIAIEINKSITRFLL